MNEKIYNEDIIIARATPPGPSAIAVIRISGKNSWEILKKIFVCKNKIKSFESHKSYFGKIVNKTETIDQVIIITYSENNSFTGEESFEINCHGSEVIISLIINLLISNSARIAEPGEFSKRAFLNGKINLTEAEAVMDIVYSSTKNSSLIAVRQLSGKISEEINIIKNKISDLLAEIEVNIDYPEEDLIYSEKKWIEEINKINKMFNSLLNGFTRGHFYREGIHTVILGKTNSGKSTLFNFLLNKDKAIVSDIHGTTRDYLDGVINIKGYGVRIYDTAGLRESSDPIEKEGTKRALDLSKKVNITIYVIAGDDGFTEQDKNNIKNITNMNKNMLIIINKIDLVNNNQLNDIISKIKKYLKIIKINFKIIKMSALNKIGIENFNKSFILQLTGEDSTETEDPIITNSRHADLLNKANQSLQLAIEKIKQKLLDLAAFEIRDSLDKLGEITGEVTKTDIINKIFSNFCVGK